MVYGDGSQVHPYVNLTQVRLDGILKTLSEGNEVFIRGVSQGSQIFEDLQHSLIKNAREGGLNSNDVVISYLSLLDSGRVSTKDLSPLDLSYFLPQNKAENPLDERFYGKITGEDWLQMVLIESVYGFPLRIFDRPEKRKKSSEKGLIYSMLSYGDRTIKVRKLNRDDFRVEIDTDYGPKRGG